MSTHGTVFGVVAPGGVRYVRIYAYMKGSDEDKATEMCNKAFGAGNFTIGPTPSYCFLDIPL
jgi:hypothetical protein